MKKTFFVLLFLFVSFVIFAQEDSTITPVKTDETTTIVSTSGAETITSSGAFGNFGDFDGEHDIELTPTPDPYEKYNRVVFGFNDMLDKFFLKPVATFYNKVIPLPLNRGLDHVFQNLDTVPTIFNDALQYNFYQMVSDSWRLAINTTIGLGGFFDVADKIGLPPNTEDFGLTLAQWGYKNSNYFMVPFLGPRTIRDTLGVPVNIVTSLYFPLRNESITFRYGLFAWKVIDKRAQLLRFQGVYENMALDKYVFIRNAYMQRRNYLIERNTQLDNPYTAKDMQKMHEDYFLDE